MTLWAKKFSWFCQNCILLFRGASEQNKSRLLFLARFFKHGLPKLYSTCPEALFAELFPQNHNNWHCERKKISWFWQICFLFSVELLSKKFSFSSPCQILQAWVAKTVFYVSSGTFCGIFFRRIILIGTVSEKIQLVLSKLYYFFRGTFEQTILEVVLLDFFPVPARFFKRGLPKLYSTCPEALFADFFSQNLINWHCERKNWAAFVQTAFYFSGELLGKQFSKLNHINWQCERKNSAAFVQTAFYFSGELLSKQFSKLFFWIFFQSLPDSLSVGFVSRGTFCGIFFTESY